MRPFEDHHHARIHATWLCYHGIRPITSRPASLKIASRSSIANGFAVSPASTTLQGINSSGLTGCLTRDVVGRSAWRQLLISLQPRTRRCSMKSCTQTPFLVFAMIYNGRILWRRRPPHPRRSATGRLAEAEEIAGVNEPETDSLWESLSWDRSFATSPPTKFDDAAIDESCLLELLQHPSGRKPCREHTGHILRSSNREKARVDRQVPAAPSAREFFLSPSWMTPDWQTLL